MGSEIGNIWIKLGLGSADYSKGTKQIISDTKATTSLISSAFKTAVDAAQVSLRSLKSVKLKDIVNTQEFGSAIGQLKSLQAEYGLTAAKTSLTATASEKLSAQIAYLNRSLGLHRMAMGSVNAAYQSSLATKGADAAETKRLYSELVKLQTTEANLVNSVKQAEAALAQQGAQITKQNAATQKLGTNTFNLRNILTNLAATAATGAGLFLITDSAVKAGEAVYRLSAKLGITTQEAAELNKVLKVSDVDSQALTSTLIRVDKAIQTAGDKGNRTTRALKALNVNLTDGNGKFIPYNEQLEQLALGYERAAKTGEEEAYITAVLGARGQELIPLLKDYAINMEAASKVKGIGIDPEQARQQAIDMKMLKLQANQLSMAFASALIPVAQEIIPTIMAGLKKLVELLKSNKAELIAIGAGAATFMLVTKGVGLLTTATTGLSTAQFISTAATKGLTAALTASPFGLIALAAAALAGGIYYLSQQQTGLVKSTNDYLKVANQESVAHEQKAKLIENQISTMQKMSGQYSDLKTKIDSGTLSDNEAVKAKASLTNMESQLIPIIGQEGIARINAANNTNEAFKSEIEGMQTVLSDEKKMINELIFAEDERTRNQVTQIETRINNLAAGAAAQMKFGEKLKSWWVSAGSYDLEPEQGEMARQYVEDQARARETRDLEAERTRLINSLHFTPSTGVDTGGILTDLGADLDSAGDSASEAADQVELASEKITAAEKQSNILGLAMSILQEQMKQAANSAAVSSDKLGELQIKEAFLNQELTKQRGIIANLDQQYQESIVTKDQAAQKEADLKAQYDASIASLGANAKETKKLGDQLEKASEETVKTAQHTDDLALKLTQAKTAQSDYALEISETRKAMSDYRSGLVDIQKELDAVQKKYDEDMAAALDDYNQKSKDVNSQLIDDIQRVNDEYDQAIEDRTSSLMNWTGLFEAVDLGESVSGTDLLGNLQGQVTAFEEWSSNIQALAARGVDEGLIEELRKLGPEAGPQIAALLTLTNEQLTRYAALFKEKQTLAREEATAELEQQKIEMEQKITELRAATAVQLEQYKKDWLKTNATIKANSTEAAEDIKKKFIETAGAATIWGKSIGENVAAGIQDSIGSIRAAVNAVLAEIDRLNSAGSTTTTTTTTGALGSLPGMAGGGYVASAGWAITGEHGPEPVYMPKGATVFPTDFAMAGGGSIGQINIYGHGADEIMDKLKRVLHKAGFRPK